MKKIKIAICDDEEISVKHIKKALEKKFLDFGIQIQADEFLSALELKNKLKEDIYSICFLDIDMPEMNGIDLAEKINEICPKTLLVFVSGKEEYVFESFRVHPFSFIRKLHFEEDLEHTIRDITKILIEKDKEKVCQIEDESGHKYTFLIDSIMYIETVEKYVRIRTNKEEKLIRNSMKNIEKFLEPYGFIRCHKSYIINGKKIYAVKYDRVILTDKTELPIRRGIASKLQAELCKYLIE